MVVSCSFLASVFFVTLQCPYLLEKCECPVGMWVAQKKYKTHKKIRKSHFMVIVYFGCHKVH